MATKKTTATEESGIQKTEPKATKKKTATKAKPVADLVPEESIEPEKDISIQPEEKTIQKEEKPKKAGKIYTVKTSSKLRIRSGAGKDFEIIGYLQNGTKVTASEEKNGWARIGAGQWVDKAFLR